MRRRPSSIAQFAVFLPLVATGVARSQAIYIDLPRPPDRSTPAPAVADTRLALVEQRITGSVGDRVASLRVEQVFSNPHPRDVEGVYLFPVPPDAIARGVELWIDGKPIPGEVLDAGKARQVYRDIVRRARDPALLEYVDRGLVRASVFPIPANGTVRVALLFASSVRDAGDVRSLTLPLRFAADAGAPCVVDVSLETRAPLATVYSPSHEVDVARDGERRARITFEGRPEPRRDMRLYYSSESSGLGMTLIAHRMPARDGTFLLVLEPPDRVHPEERAPRDVVFVLDRSGSMAGEKWTQASRAIAYGLTTLDPRDRFALISFATDVRSYKPDWVPATPEEREGARAHLETLRPAGGTQISGALHAALGKLAAEDRRLKVVAFVTDGLPTIGEIDPDRILERVRDQSPHARVFAFGIGYDVNTFLLDRLAEDHRGASDYIQEGEDIEIPVSAFFAKIREPRLVDPELSFAGIEVFDVYPQRLPDLFAGTPLVVAGRYRGDGRHAVTLSGRTPGGERESFTTEVMFPADAREDDEVALLWAARKVGFLLNEIRLHGSKPELIDQVIELAREYGIVTPYTAGLVVEEGMALGAATGTIRRERPWQPPSGAGGPASVRAALRELDLETGSGEDRARRSVGRKAVQDSLAGKRLAETDSLEELDGGVNGWMRAHASETTVAPIRLAGRRLVRVGPVVLDADFDESMRSSMIEVETYSDSWFDLALARPWLRPVLALAEELVIVVDGKAIWIHP